MARTESIAVAGYFPTPGDQLTLIANLLAPGVGDSQANSYRMAVLDPCAGDGEAIHRLSTLIAGTDAQIYSCEMEASRYKALKARGGYDKALNGDAFRITFDKDLNRGVGLLFLNPPYDTDKVTGRLEERFLARFKDTLAEGGVLVFVVPFYALSASADTLARHFERLSCYRFRGEGFDAFKQVVLFAEKRATELFDPDEAVLAQVNAWAASPPTEELPVEPVNEPYECPLTPTWATALKTWEMREVDLATLTAKFRPWMESTRQGLKLINRIVPDLPIAELLHRTYEVATPPRPAHIAAGIAAGLFNGRRVEPDDAATGLPAILVKGVFDREWRTVEEKHNKEGEKTGEVQVQQPKLVVTVLDLDKHTYHTVGSGTDDSGVLDVARMGIADLLRHYGSSLMSVMEQQCKILYDPRKDADKIELAPVARPLFAAQAHAVRANLTLLRERPGRQPYLLGEIGSGKTTVVLATAKTHGARKLLAVCPPHLLDSWRNEVASVMPEVPCVVLDSVTDVEAVAQMDGHVVAVLSREVAKLGHGWEGVTSGACPKCGCETDAAYADEYARKRMRCEHKDLIAVDRFAKLARELALRVRAYAPGEPVVRNCLRGRLDQVWRRKLKDDAENGKAKKWKGLPREFALTLLSELAYEYVFEHKRDATVQKAIMWLFAAVPDADWLRAFVLLAQDPDDWQRFVEELPLLLGVEKATEIVAEMQQRGRHTYGYDSGTVSQRHAQRIENKHLPVNLVGYKLSFETRKVTLDGVQLGSLEAAMHALAALGALGEWKWTDECGEPLFQAVPEPRRFPLAQYIVQRHKRTFDFLVLDEGHEYATEGSAQERAAHRLTTLKLPTVLMTGSVMNGYATSLFTNMWALSPEFRDEFGRSDSSTFCDRYGYRKRYVSDRKDGEVVAFGSHSDRVERSERDVGMAPGVLPLFLFRHLLPSAVTLHKADLRIDLPELTQEQVTIEPSPEQAAEYKRLLRALSDKIKADRFTEDRAGKLFGALSELPSYLDRATADVGNGDGGTYEIRYPESLDRELVAEAKMLPAKTTLPKEEWMLDTLEAELAEGRNVMVFAWHVGLLPRLQRLIEKRIGEPAPILYADKVPTGKRQAWIDREVVKKGRRVMIANPVAIQTGLNNLVHFATEIWHENPACNPIVYRQAIGRIDRIGQRKPTRVLFATYGGTLQAQMYELLIAKVAVSTATDGLDPESALRASGIVEDEYLTGLSIGKQLWAMLSGEGPRPRLVVSNPAPKPTKKPAPALAPVEQKALDALDETLKGTVMPEQAERQKAKVREFGAPPSGIPAEMVREIAAVTKVGEVAKRQQAKRALAVSDLNANETKVLMALGTFDGAATIAELAEAAFKNRPTKAKANSWVRNSLRRLLRENMIEHAGKGTYAIVLAEAKEVKDA